MAEPETTPVLLDSMDQRENIRNKTLKALQGAFPLTARNYTIDLANASVKKQDYSSKEQKQAILEGKSLNERIVGDVTVKDASGKVVDTAKNFTLLHLPYFTPRHTFIIDGNEYTIASQIRTKPGIYTRKRGNDELEASFNLSKGMNFRLSMEPEKGQLNMEYGTTKIPLYPVLRSLGVQHQDIVNHWGAGVADLNKNFVRNPDLAINKLYEKIIHPSKQTATTTEAKTDAVREYYNNTTIDPETTQTTLGHPFDKVSNNALLAASKKLLDVHRAGVDTDDRDSLEFKNFHHVDDFIAEKIGFDAKQIKNKIGLKLEANGGDIRKAIPPGIFTRGVKAHITGSKRSAIPTQINPLEVIDQASRLTSLGEGGIGSERAIPEETRNLHASHLGIIDPVLTPETLRAGIDVRTSLWARRDDKGNLYTPLFDAKGNRVVLSAKDIKNSVIAFPNQNLKKGGMVDVIKDGEVTSVPASQVTHQVRHIAGLYSPATNLIPFINSMQGNRVMMAGKHLTQALSLVSREAPNVQVASWRPGISFEQEIIKKVVPTTPVSGTVEKIDKDWIYIRPDKSKHACLCVFDPLDEHTYNDFAKYAAKEDLIKIHYDTNFPLAAKSYLHNTINVKEGDKVKAEQTLADSNYTKDGALALGTNLKIGYLGYRGLNSNDGIVISQSGANKLVSDHMYKQQMDTGTDVNTSKEKHRAYYGSKYTARQYNQLDENGVVKPGTVVQPGDPVILGLRKNEITGNSALLGKLSKSLVKPYREEVVTWTHDHPGEVVDIVKTPLQHMVTVKTQEPIVIGDKLSGRYGNKGVISKIIPDDQMIQDESGKPVDLLFTSAGIISRINPAQVLEASLGKVAAKTGKPIAVENFADHDNVQYAKDLLKKHGLKDKETVYDPVTGKHIKNVFIGNSYILKLFKTTDSNWSTHNAERYDINQQPVRGGDEGAKAIGKMEFDGLVAHNARNILREAASIKSQKNDEFWRALQLGTPLPAPKTTFAYDKFLNMLQAGGIKVNKSGNKISLGPMTDNDITAMSSGEIKDGNKTILAKNLEPEKGGLFDPTITGGLGGTKWAHVTLSEPLVNPVFEEPVRRLLNLTNNQFTELHATHGGKYFRDELGKIDMDKKIDELRTELKSYKSKADIDGAVKQIKYLEALKAHNLTPDKAYVLSKVPVAPPIIRPIQPMKDGRLQVSDANLLYKDAFLANKQLGDVKGILPNEELKPLRTHLYDAVSAVFGTGLPVSPTAEKRGAKGFLHQVEGNRPGSGFFQAKLMKRNQDVSGRATIAPDPTLSIDEVGVPIDMLWGMYGKFIIARLVKKGYTALKAQEMVDNKDYVAKQELLMEAKERPIIVNRAPSLHRQSIVAAYPKLVEGKTLRLNPFMEKGMSADYDGDAVQIHAPVTAGGISDAKKMTLSNQIFTDKRPGVLNVAPDHEAVIGLYRASKGATSTRTKDFATKGDALAAYHAGDLGLNDKVTFKK